MLQLDSAYSGNYLSTTEDHTESLQLNDGHFFLRLSSWTHAEWSKC